MVKENLSMQEKILGILLQTVLPIILTFICTAFLNRRSDTRKNGGKIDQLSRQIGLNDQKTLSECIKDKMNEITKDIGRDGDASLTKQHLQIEQTISHNFKIIASRYKAEDDAYRHFTMQQRDIKVTLDNFSRDYLEHIESEKILFEKCSELEEKLEQLAEENTRLKQLVRQAKQERSHDHDSIS